MKKKVFLLLLSASVLTASITGCGRKQDNANDNTANENMTGTESVTNEDLGTESLMEGTENNTTSQLQLGNAVEIPEGWDGELAETEPHAQLERAIADYCNVAKEDYANVRYYYNYVDLNGDSVNEILALVLGKDVAGIDGNVLLWLDAADENITKDSVKQSFSQVGAPVYICNHMTSGYRDLIIAGTNTQSAAGETTTEQAETVRETEAAESKAGANTRTSGTTTDDGAGANTRTGEATTDDGAGANGTTSDTTNGTNTDTNADTGMAISNAPGSQYMLLVWDGTKYQNFSEGTVLDSLEGYEGTAILTNNMESDLANDNYHFLGEAMK